MGLVRALVAPPKAAIGPGVASIEMYAPLSMLSPAPQKLMSEAQKVYASNIWVNAAERVINSRLARVAYHLERADGETVTPRDASPAEQQVLDLLGHPTREQQRASTRRGLWGLSSRHVGLCGNGFWYHDQPNLLTGAPLGILYINAVRMTPATDATNTLVGWVLDDPSNPVTGRPGRPGVPIQLDEVEHLVLDEPDDGPFGLGIVQAAWSKIELSRLADRHTSQLLATGGRLAGLMSPKEADSISAEQWEATQRAWRRIADDPEAAKRLHIVRGPVEFTSTAATPNELGLNDLLELSRTDVLAAWQVPPSQLGIAVTRGLNSGEVTKYDEAALWQGPIEDRADAVRAAAQAIIDLFGLGLTLVLETPAFDDQAPLYENASKAANLPLTVDDRRELVGLDPLDPAIYGDLGAAVYIDQSMVRIDAPAAPTASPPKASLAESLAALHQRVQRDEVRRVQREVGGVLEDMARTVASRVERNASHLLSKPSDASVWWDESAWLPRLAEAVDLGPMAVEVATAQAVRFERVAGAKADPWIERVGEYVRQRGLDRVRGMLRTVRASIQAAIDRAVRDGATASDLSLAVREASGFDEYSAERIARTEVMNAYNDASLRTYREFGTVEVIAADGDTDPECAQRNGRTYTLDEADSISDHPNGTLTWIPQT